VRANEVSDLPTLQSSPGLVLVLACLAVTLLASQPTIDLLRGVSLSLSERPRDRWNKS